MRLGLDYTSHIPARTLKEAGATAAFRYVSSPGNPKNITRAEVVDLTAAGVAIVLVFETTANRALQGGEAGLFDAQAARSQARDVGLAGAPIYFAVDFDATPADQAKINSYLLGAASVLGHDKVGVYGSFYVVKRCLQAGVCRYGWQTEAWSGGQWFAGAHVQQHNGGLPGKPSHVGGVSVDWNVVMAGDFGQYRRTSLPTPTPAPAPPPKPAPSPAPAPKPVPKPPAPVRFPAASSHDFWAWARWRDAGALPADRPKVVNPVPLAWVVRYYLHSGAKTPLPTRLRKYLNQHFPV